jgi:hypothetical protein
MSDFKGLIYRKVGIIYPIPLKRKLSHCINIAFQKYRNSTTIDIFSNISHVSKTYYSNKKVLEKLYKVLEKSEEITKLKLNHNSSELGLPYEIKFLYENILVSYDGLSYNIESEVTKDEFNLEDIENLLKYRKFDKAIRVIEESLSKIQKESHSRLETQYHYIKEVRDFQFKNLNTKKKFLIQYNDTRYFTSNFSTKEPSQGKINRIYCNDYQDIIENEALHLFLSQEFSQYSFKFDDIKEKIVKSEELLIEQTNVFNSIISIFKKFKGWNQVKKDISLIIRIKSYFSKLFIVSNSMVNLVDSNKDYFVRFCESNIIAISGVGKIDTKKKYPYFDLGMQYLHYNGKIEEGNQLKPSMYYYSKRYIEEIIHTWF